MQTFHRSYRSFLEFLQILVNIPSSLQGQQEVKAAVGMRAFTKWFVGTPAVLLRVLFSLCVQRERNPVLSLIAGLQFTRESAGGSLRLRPQQLALSTAQQPDPTDREGAQHLVRGAGQLSNAHLTWNGRLKVCES